MISYEKIKQCHTNNNIHIKSTQTLLPTCTTCMTIIIMVATYDLKEMNLNFRG